MKKFLQFFFIISAILFQNNFAHADILNDCMRRVSDNADFKKAMTEEIFKDPNMLTQEGATQNKSKIMGLIAGEVLLNCIANLGTLTKSANGKVWYERDNKKYAFQFKMEELFQYINIQTGVMLYNKPSLSVGDVIKLSDIKKLYWSDECSDHTIWDNLDDDASVNIAGQKVFSQYGGSDNEFFLDFEEGNDRRAFPGLVLMDKTGSTAEKIVSFNNLHSAIAATQSFATALNSSSCSNDGLSAYVVALNVKPDDTDRDAWAVGAGVTGGTMAFLGLAYAATLSTAAAAAGSSALVSGLLSVAGAASSVPVWGWIAAGVIAAAAGAISLIPSELADIRQVMVMDGPYLIR